MAAYFVRPALTNATDCRLYNDTCNGHGVCGPATGWCVCAAGYDLLTRCATPFFDAIPVGWQMGALVLAFVYYAIQWTLFFVELLHHYCEHGARKALRAKNFGGWVSHTALLFLTMRIGAYIMWSIEFATRRVRLQAAITILNTLGLVLLSCTFVISTTLWMYMLQRGKGLGDVKTFYRVCRKVNLWVMGICDVLGGLITIVTAAGNLPLFLYDIAQVFGTAGTLIPLLITMWCLGRMCVFLCGLSASERADNRLIATMLFKTKTMVAIVVALILVFALTFALRAGDAEMSGVIMLRCYFIVVADMLIMPLLFYVAQTHARGPDVSFFGTFFTKFTRATPTTGTSGHANDPSASTQQQAPSGTPTTTDASTVSVTGTKSASSSSSDNNTD